MLRQLSHSNIEYLVTDGRKGYNWPFYTGCEHWRTGVCGGGGKDFNCWAKRMADRFNKGNFTPTLHPEKLLDPLHLKRPSKIAVCFTGDLFGDWVEPYGIVTPGGTWLKEAVFSKVKQYPQHTFLFLTKAPWNLPKWGEFPDNAWVGLSATNMSQIGDIPILQDVQARVRFVSFEPMLDYTAPDLRGIDWIILGAATAPYRPPRIEWVNEICEAANKAGVPVWLKNNLKPLFDKCARLSGIGYTLRQELPIAKTNNNL